MNKAGCCGPWRSGALAGLLLLLLSAPASAELGDYGFWRTLGNLASPPGADNPVTSDQRQGAYPLLANPEGYENFSAGAYYQWQTIALAPETGAVCGNGSDTSSS